MFTDEYIYALTSEGLRRTSRKKEYMKARIKIPYLKCVKTIDKCPELEVGDLLLRLQEDEIWFGGYEYAVCKRRDDGMTFKFRTEHLDDCFEIEEVEEERLIWMGGNE